jgi:hypothetical protein
MITRMLIAGAFALATTLPAQADQKPAFVQKAALYPLTTCVVSNEPLDDDAVTFEVDGTTFRTCCKKCVAKVRANPASFRAKVEAAAIAAQLPMYPLDVCPVSGAKLGSKGEPIQLLLDGTLVQLCCKRCVDKATADATAMADKVRAAAHDAQRKTYPIATCVVSGEALEDDAIDVMYGTTLVRMCCPKCAKAFEKDPAKYLERLHAAGAAAPKEHGKGGDHDGPGHHDGDDDDDGHGEHPRDGGKGDGGKKDHGR